MVGISTPYTRELVVDESTPECTPVTFMSMCRTNARASSRPLFCRLLDEGRGRAIVSFRAFRQLGATAIFSRVASLRE